MVCILVLKKYDVNKKKFKKIRNVYIKLDYNYRYVLKVFLRMGWIFVWFGGIWDMSFKSKFV